jgi:hypothetical protein
MRLKLGFNEGGLGVTMEPVEAALVGTGGFALDFSDTSRMWTTSTKTTLVAAASDPIGAIRSKWGAAEYDVVQGSTGIRPTWNGSVAGDFVPATTQQLSAIAAAALLNNKPAGFACARVIFDSLAAVQPIICISTTTSSSRRFHLVANADGSLTLTIRRVDGGSQTLVSSAAGVVTTATPYTITMTCDYAGTRAISVRINGAAVISTTLVEAAGNTSATASGAFLIGKAIGTLDYLDGRISRMVFADKVFTLDEIAIIEAWVGQGALT